MNNLENSLSFFEKIISSEVGSKKMIQRVFQDVLGVTIPVEKISKEEFSLYIEAHPVIKNEIALHEEELQQNISRIINQKIDRIN